MEEGAADIAAPGAGRTERAALPVSKFGKRRVVSGRRQRRIVKLMTAHGGAGSADRAVAEKPRLAVTEMEPAVHKAGRMTKQPGHGMARATGIFEAFAEHDEAAAFPMHRARLRKARQPSTIWG